MTNSLKYIQPRCCIQRKEIVDNHCDIWEMGSMSYDKAYKLQKELRRKRVIGLVKDILLFVEHFPTFTIGRSGSVDNVLISRAEQAKLGISLYTVERGGDVTYHGPGQIVVYPIMNLANRDKDVHGFVYKLEEVMIRTLQDFGIDSKRDEIHTGVWIGREKAAAIGRSIRKWVTMHGIALNVNTNLDHFEFINPCGFKDRKATSMQKLLGHKLSMKTVQKYLIGNFLQVFNIESFVLKSSIGVDHDNIAS